MRNTKLLSGILLCITALSVSGQSSKNIFGTFAVGCKVFNYELIKAPSGLYSFAIENIEEGSSIIPFDKQIVKNIKVNLSKISIADTANKYFKQNDYSYDSISLISLGWIRLCENILADSVTLTYLQSNSESLKNLFDLTKQNKIDEYMIAIHNDTAFKTFLNAVDSLLSSVASIATKRKYTLNDFNQESFTYLIETILNRYKFLFDPECSYDLAIGKKATSLFFDIKARLEFEDDEPVTAYLELKAMKVNLYYSKNSKLQMSSKDIPIVTKLEIEKVTAEFEDGNIKNLFVDLKPNTDSLKDSRNLPIRFKNTYPISVSGRNDPDKFGYIKIYAEDPSDLYRIYKIDKSNNDFYKLQIIQEAEKFKPFSSTDTVNVVESILSNKEAEKTNKSSNNKDENIQNDGQFYVLLSDLLKYNIVAQTDNEDYSPANTVVCLNKENPSQQLKKELRSRILSVRTYTDFVGIKGDQPNGLIQFEASRRINLRTSRLGTKGIYYGLFTYLEPVLTFSKIEKNNNAVPLNFSDLDSFQLSQQKKVMIVNTIDLLKYQSSSFDLNINFEKINITSIKSNFQINLSAGLIRTNVTDTIEVIGTSAIKSENANDATLTSFRWGPSVIYELKPDTRYGLSIGWDYRSLNLLSKSYELPSSPIPVGITNSFWMDAYLKTNDNNRFFFRYKITYVSGASDQNFSQVQLGYLLDIFKSNSK